MILIFYRKDFFPNASFENNDSRNLCSFYTLTAIMKLFQNHSKDGRVVLPLLKTCDIVLSRGSLDSVILQEGNVDILRQLLTCLKKEAHQCTDVIRLLQIFMVALGLLCGKSKSFVSKPLIK